MERATAPMPWPVEAFYLMPDDMFAFLFGLTQAWPLLRSEIRNLETLAGDLLDENAAHKIEHPRLADRINTTAKALRDERDGRAREVAELRAVVTRMAEEIATLRAKVRALPSRLAAAEAVCRSINTIRSGSGGAFAHYDGAAHDAWKALVS